MPRPGSHSYDTERARLRKNLEHDRGMSEKELKERVDKTMHSDPAKRPRKVGGDRANGPKAERPTRGEEGK
ncbi:hypothetical protein ACFFMN_15185 [Planobispora siamensis]|uniref:Uncharacterized protein n=1 Tax=Planobispora siamensis TaxID=936338 RepID=A0A8J3SRX4_9ACTN|nr:hypothetical protein [Planobispora siamensis]GIH97284.1 hypothetical protein Psi01_79140 [Planobispora siamensis]